MINMYNNFYHFFIKSIKQIQAILGWLVVKFSSNSEIAADAWGLL